jgi:hypothetical protein
MTSARFAGSLAGIVALAVTIGAHPAPTPVQSQAGPPPFPGSNRPPVTRAGATPPQVAGAADAGAVDPRLAGVPLFPGVELLETIDVGSGQTVFMFGTNEPHAALVAFYKTQLRKSGDEVSRTPAIQQFDLGSFNSNTMAQRPSVIVKDFTWPDPAGYLHVSGVTERRFKTLIQIIPVAK